MPERKDDEKKGRSMTVEEAGHKGGQRVKELIEEGKEQEAQQGGRKDREED